MAIEVAPVQPPVVEPGALEVGRVHQGQGVFGQVRSNARVDEFDFARLALKGCVQAAAQDVEVTPGHQAGGILLAGELGQEAVAVIELVDQGAAFVTNLADSPLAAAVEQRQLALIPFPFASEALQ
ncbi:hypothetical protein D3C80_1361050 [compost metagenome]